MHLQSLNIYLLLSLGLFAVGIFGVLLRRSALFVLMSIEVMLFGVNLTLITFSRYYATDLDKAMTGQVLALVIMFVAVIEAALGIALFISLYRYTRDHIEVDQLGELEG